MGISGRATRRRNCSYFFVTVEFHSSSKSLRWLWSLAPRSVGPTGAQRGHLCVLSAAASHEPTGNAIVLQISAITLPRLSRAMLASARCCMTILCWGLPYRGLGTPRLAWTLTILMFERVVFLAGFAATSTLVRNAASKGLGRSMACHRRPARPPTRSTRGTREVIMKWPSPRI